MLRRVASLVVVAALTLQGISAAAKTTKMISPTETKRRVERLGLGQHVMVKTVQREELHGHILKIAPQTFTLKPDRSAQTGIAYADVLKVRKNPGPVLWILVGAALVVIIIVAVR